MSESAAKPWFLYLLKTADGTLYAGITTDLERRLKTHNAGKGSRYTALRRPVELVAAWQTIGQGRATQLERALKSLSRPRKLALIADVGRDFQEAVRVI